VLIDDRAGNTSQALGVAEALGVPFEQIPIGYSSHARLPNILRGASLWGVSTEARSQLVSKIMVDKKWPSLVIAAGRRTAPVARWIKSQAYVAKQSCALCQIMDPGRAGRADFDVVAIPRHDRKMPTGSNILPITGSPHRVTAQKLCEEKAAWADRLESLKTPRIAVLVGGKTKAHDFSDARAAALGRAISGLATATGGQVMVTTSRRTGKSAEQALLAELPENVWSYRWGDDGENPYFGFLSWADILVVTGDSMSMASEACGTDKPVIIEAPQGMVSAKHARLHDVLVTENRAVRLTENTDKLLTDINTLECTPMNSAHTIVDVMKKMELV